jgi:hypothetical protein
LQRGRQLTRGSAELFEQELSKTRVWIADVYGLYELFAM